MDLIERIEWFSLGCFIGLILGYIVRGLHDIKQELDEVETNVKRLRDDRGIVRHPILADAVLLLVVAMTAWAAWSSQQSSNKVVDLQSEQKQNLDCTTQIAFDTIEALNDRTTYTGAQTNANIALVQAQFDFLTRLAEQPPPTDAEALQLYNDYVTTVAEFLELAKKTKDKQIENPYPTVHDLTDCLAQTSEQTEEPKE